VEVFPHLYRVHFAMRLHSGLLKSMVMNELLRANRIIPISQESLIFSDFVSVLRLPTSSLLTPHCGKRISLRSLRVALGRYVDSKTTRSSN